MPPKRPVFKKGTVRATRITPTVQTVSAQETPVSTQTDSVNVAENLIFSTTTQRPEWDSFYELMKGSCTILEEKPAKDAMSILTSTLKTPFDVVKQELEYKKILIRRVGTNIVAHHVDNSSVTFTMPDLTQPILWVYMLQDIFTQKKVPSPAQPSVPHQMQLLLALLAKLPPVQKLVVHKKEQEIILNVVGKGFDAIVRLVGEEVFENRSFPQLCVPWRKITQANTALGTQIIMMPDDSTINLVEIVSTPVGGYIGVHNYGIGGFLCLSLTNAMAKYLLSKPTLIRLDSINPSLVVIKTPNTLYHGVIKQIEKSNREFVWLEGERRSWSEIVNLDTVLSEFSQQGKL